MSRRILLVEPGYRNKYPPLGLMKISSYHKMRGDFVQFVKGCDPLSRLEQWDRVYVATLFTFHWQITLDTLAFYLPGVAQSTDVWVGGVLATLMGDQIEQDLGVTVVKGLLDHPGMLDASDTRTVVDRLTPDYRMLADTAYEYALSDAYVGYATRGCPNKCGFCAVHTLEPDYVDYMPLRSQVRAVEEVFGARHDLILMDNNILASARFDEIIDDILELGFEKGAKLKGRLRRLDFNQGTDARLLTPHKMRRFAETALDPLRLAFDDIRMAPTYEQGIQLAASCGVSNLSNYVLFNYLDTPSDFYQRLSMNVGLNETLGTSIYSFPMKYVPLDAKDRSHVGRHWDRQLLRGVQCILAATRGMVGPKRPFFEAAFGVNEQEFLCLAHMPEEYIIHRKLYHDDGAESWAHTYHRLTKSELAEFEGIVSRGRVAEVSAKTASSGRVRTLLAHHVRGEELRRSREKAERARKV